MLPDKDFLKDELIFLYKKLNKQITQRDVVKYSKYKIWMYKKAFGNFNNAKKYCGIPVLCERLNNEELVDLLNKKLIEKGGVLLSDKKDIKNKNSKIKVKCKKCDYIFDTSISRLNRSWCPQCGGTKQKTMQDVLEAAKNKNLTCLSKEYNNAYTKLKFKCKQNHIFELSGSKLWNTTAYCPSCSSGLYERICRCYFEQLFNYEFPSTYPEWLINSKGNRMQLDGYCKELNIAFEHQGRQHYEKNFFVKTDKDLKARIFLDKEKEEICKNNNVKLFVIPELERDLYIKDLKDYIKNKCKELDISIPKEYDSININLNRAYSSDDNFKILEIKEKIKEKNGILLYMNYLGTKSKIKIKCVNGNVFYSEYYRLIKQNQWCGCDKCLKLHNKISEETIEEFIKLYLSGLTIKEAAKRCGFKKSYGFVILRDRNLTRNKSEARKLIKLKRKYEHLKEEIIRLKNEGYNNSRIAKMLGIKCNKTIKRYV